VKKVRWYCATDRPLHFAKPLKGKEAGWYRFRIGEYRVVFDVTPNGNVTILGILKIAHRKDVYV
jgi:mRNA interferase RelE/StbE